MIGASRVAGVARFKVVVRVDVAFRFAWVVASVCPDIFTGEGIDLP